MWFDPGDFEMLFKLLASGLIVMGIAIAIATLGGIKAMQWIWQQWR